MKQYFIITQGKSHGPFSLEELKQQRIAPDTLVWREGMDAWQKATIFPELARLLPPGHPGARLRNRTRRYGLFLVVFLLVLAAFGVWMLKHSRGEQQKKTSEEMAFEKQEYEKNYTRKHISELVHCETNEYHTRTLGGISGLKVSVKNESVFSMDRVLVEVHYLKSKGGVFKTEVLHFNNIAANTTQTQYAPESSRGSKVAAEIAVISCAEIGL